MCTISKLVTKKTMVLKMMNTCKKMLMSLVGLLLVTSVSASEQWIQFAKTDKALYELDGSSISADNAASLKLFKLRITPTSPFAREDKTEIKWYIEYGLTLCDKRRYVVTGQDHFGIDNKFIDSNIGSVVLKASGEEHDVVTHLMSIVCKIPFVDAAEEDAV